MIFEKSTIKIVHWYSNPVIFFGTFTCATWFSYFHTIAIATYFPLSLFAFFQWRDSQTTSESWKWSFLLCLFFAFQFNSNNPLFITIAFLWTVIVFWVCDFKKITNYKILSLLVLVGLLCTPTLYFASQKNNFFAIGRYESSTHDKVNIKGLMVEMEDPTQSPGVVVTPQNLYQSIRSDFYWQDFHLVFGKLGFLFLIFGLLQFKTRHYFKFLISMGLLLWISLGPHAGLTPLLYKYVPWFSSIRNVGFFIIYVYVFCTLFVAIGVEAFFKLSSQHLSRIQGYHWIPLAILFYVSLVSLNRSFALYNSLQPTPQAIKRDFEYLGNFYQPRRRYKLPSLGTFVWMKDAYFSQGEPLLLYKDSVRFLDNGSQWLMPLKLWEFLNSNSSEKESLLGINAPKLKFPSTDKLSTYEILDFSANQLKVFIHAPKPTEIFYSQTLMPGWKVLREGKTAALETSNHPFMETQLPSGEYTLQFKYVPLALIAALIFYYFVQILSLGGLFVWVLKKLREALPVQLFQR